MINHKPPSPTSTTAPENTTVAAGWFPILVNLSTIPIDSGTAIIIATPTHVITVTPTMLLPCGDICAHKNARKGDQVAAPRI